MFALSYQKKLLKTNFSNKSPGQLTSGHFWRDLLVPSFVKSIFRYELEHRLLLLHWTFRRTCTMGQGNYFED